MAMLGLKIALGALAIIGVCLTLLLMLMTLAMWWLDSKYGRHMW